MAETAGAKARPDLVATAMSRARAGDEAARHFLYVRYADSVRDHLRALGATPDDARAITQQLFVELPVVLPGGHDEARFESWLMRAAERAARRAR
jgi:DNA-directed RNA polymerase specialized sigma24 family protein